MTSRIELVSKLISFPSDLENVVKELTSFEWDSEPLLILEPSHISAVLQRFVAGELSEDKVCEWANAIECRDDIALSMAYENILKSAIHWLANPEINGKLSVEQAVSAINDLEASNPVPFN